MEALILLGLNPGQHGLVNAAVAAGSTDSSTFPRMVLPNSPRSSAMQPIPDIHVYPQASRLSGECSPEVSVVAPSTPAPAPNDLKATPVAGGSSSGGVRKRARQMLADVLPGARSLFDGMPAFGDDDYMQNIIFEGGAAAACGIPSSKKEDKRDAASNALIISVEGMMSKKDLREEEHWRYKEEQMNAFMEIQRRRLEMDAEKQAKMLEMEMEKQAKMLEIEAANAKTKAKEVTLASRMTGVEIMKVDLNTVSPRKRSWFEKMQADMLKFDDE
ncbi:hypothetical protein VPH35_091793 [Triticum aestivum]